MSGDWIQNFTIAFALVTGTGAGLLVILMWEIFRQTLFGRALFVLLVVMSTFVVYHVVLLTLSNVPLVAELLESVVFTGVVAFMVLMIRTQHRMRGQHRMRDVEGERS